MSSTRLPRPKARFNEQRKEAKMVDESKAAKPLEDLGAGGVPPIPPEPADPFDLANLRIDPAFIENAGVTKLLTTVPVAKPRPQDFVRVRKDAEYRDTFAVLEWQEDREFYVVVPSVAQELPGECVYVRLYTTINRQGVVSLWPVKLPGSDGRVLEWHRSLGEAAERAMEGWVRVRANRSLGAYEIFLGSPSIPKPEWPEISFQELVRVGFRDRLVDRLDHPLITKLRGLA